jgi:hypothetical protein
LPAAGVLVLKAVPMEVTAVERTDEVWVIVISTSVVEEVEEIVPARR